MMPPLPWSKRLKFLPGNRIYLEVCVLYLLIFISFTGLYWLQSIPASLFRALLHAFTFIFLGWCQFALSHALHETVHYNFGSPHSELFGLLFTAYPIGLTCAYRTLHQKHHSYFGKPIQDPDYTTYAPFPRSRVQFFGRLLKQGSGLAAFQQFFRAGSMIEPKELLCLLLVQAGIITLFSLTLGWEMYFLFWVGPLVTVAKLLTSTRSLCEHGSREGEPVWRSFSGSSFLNWTLGIFDFHFHGIHHANPSLPHRSLRAEFGSIRLLPLKHVIHDGGYGSLLLGWFVRLPWMAS
ncbi:MAG: fatty acid desaturase [Deltaproteobacteria bacterium]|nr:fatty acid desaturase [Deltaproteobacteria bacterium]MBI3294778.1 fatty acid desaturase [Deltaproteobacteria bacterium]